MGFQKRLRLVEIRTVEKGVAFEMCFASAEIEGQKVTCGRGKRGKKGAEQQRCEDRKGKEKRSCLSSANVRCMEVSRKNKSRKGG